MSGKTEEFHRGYNSGMRKTQNSGFSKGFILGFTACLALLLVGAILARPVVEAVCPVLYLPF